MGDTMIDRFLPWVVDGAGSDDPGKVDEDQKPDDQPLRDWPVSGLPLYSQTPVVRPDIYRQLGLTTDAATVV
jgi:hypothetical protein